MTPSCVRRDYVTLEFNEPFTMWMITAGFGPCGHLSCEFLCMGWEL